MAIIRGKFKPRLTNSILNTIRSLGFLDIDRGPWVAGGAVRRILTGIQSGGDIDIFLPSDPNNHWSIHDHVFLSIEGRNDHLKQEFPRFNAQEVDRKLPMKSYTLNNYHKPQVITNRSYGSAEDLINDFDYTVAMAATDGWSWIVDSRFFTDCTTKTLAFNNVERRRRNGLRLHKYCLNYGFTPEPGMLATTLGLDLPDFETQFDNSGIWKSSDSYV